jgi:hypothetical protein
MTHTYTQLARDLAGYSVRDYAAMDVSNISLEMMDSLMGEGQAPVRVCTSVWLSPSGVYTMYIFMYVCIVQVLC